MPLIFFKIFAFIFVVCHENSRNQQAVREWCTYWSHSYVIANWNHEIRKVLLASSNCSNIRRNLHTCPQCSIFRGAGLKYRLAGRKRYPILLSKCTHTFRGFTSSLHIHTVNESVQSLHLQSTPEKNKSSAGQNEEIVMKSNLSHIDASEMFNNFEAPCLRDVSELVIYWEHRQIDLDLYCRKWIERSKLIINHNVWMAKAQNEIWNYGLFTVLLYELLLQSVLMCSIALQCNHSYNGLRLQFQAYLEVETAISIVELSCISDF